MGEEYLSGTWSYGLPGPDRWRRVVLVVTDNATLTQMAAKRIDYLMVARVKTVDLFDSDRAWGVAGIGERSTGVVTRVTEGRRVWWDILRVRLGWRSLAEETGCVCVAGF